MARLRGRRWQADVRGPQGQRLRTTFATQEAAEAWEATARLAFKEGRPPPAPSGNIPPSTPAEVGTLGGLFDYVARTEWASLRSFESAVRNGQDVVSFLGADRLTASIGAAEVSALKMHFTSQGYAPATVNRKGAALSKMLRVAKDLGEISDVPRFRWLAEAKTKFRYLDEREEKKLLAFWADHGQPVIHDLCALLLDTGARAFSELLPVRWDAFGPDFASVTFWHTKTDTPRTVPLTKRSREILRRLAEGSQEAGPFLGAGIDKASLHHRWNVMREHTGLTDVTPHTLRHTCCSRLVLRGADVKRVMVWMGHSNIQTTMRYMQIKPDALSDVLHLLET